MANLDSSSTPAEVIAEFRDTASYEEDGDVGKARRFVTACRFLLSDPQSSSEFSRSMSFDTERLEAMMNEARRFVRLRSGARSRRVRIFTPKGIR